MSSRSSSVESGSEAADASPCFKLPTGVHKRLVIRDLIVENFKSYAGRHRIGPFHKTFTAVIGPNGSGKSNVIDAMLFVFGKQAKKIRLEKLAELIHSSAAHPNLTSAAVTVTFVEIEDDPKDNAQWYETPGSAFSITREVQRNSSSQYFLNGAKMSQKDIVAFLIGKGVDLEHNRFLILQGEVEQIALMKPKAEKEGEEGLLEYFDDLIGTNQYISSIKEASTVAERCQEDRLASLDALEKVRKERDALDAAKQQTIKFATKDNQLQNYLSILCQQKVTQLEETLAEPRARLSEVDQDISKLQEQTRVACEQRDEAKAKIRLIEKNSAKHSKDRDKAKEKVDEKEAELSNVRAMVEDADKQRKKDMEKLKRLQEDLAKQAQSIADSERDAAMAQTQLFAAQRDLAEQTPIFEAERDRLQAELAPLHKKLDSLRKQAAPSAGAVAEAEEYLTTTRQAKQDLEARLSRAGRDLATAERDLAEHQRRLEHQAQLLADGRRVAADAAARAGPIDAAIDAAQRQMADVVAQIQQINHQQQEEAVDDKVASFLSKVSGIGYFGTLRQLGSIDERYDIAAGVAAQQMWGYHVVESQEAAQSAMQLLRENNLGRASFIPLNKVSREMTEVMREPIVPPKGTQRLFDLVTCKPQFAPAMYFALRNTLVTDTLELAQKIGLGGGRMRVVTLRGDLVEPGSVTGGGTAPQGARLKGGASPADVAAIAQRHNELQAERQAIGTRLDALRVERQQLADHARERGLTRVQEDELVRSVQQLEASVQGLTDRVKRLQREATQAQSQQSDVDQASADVAEAEARLEAARTKHAGFAAAIERAEQEKASVGGEEFEALQVRVTELRKKEKELDRRHQTALAAVKAATNASERRKREIEMQSAKINEAADQAAADAKARMAQLQSEADELHKKVLQHITALQQAQSDIDEIKEQSAGLEKRIGELQGALEDAERVRTDLMNEMRETLDAIEKFNERVTTADTKIRENVKDFGVETWQLCAVGPRPAAAGDDPDAEDDDAGAVRRRPHVGLDLADPVNADAIMKRCEDGSFTTRVASLEVLLQYDPTHTRQMIKLLGEELQAVREKIDFEAVSRWRAKDLACREQQAAYDDLRAKLQDAEDTLARLKEERKTKFMSVFKQIQLRLKQMYQLLANGGDAEIELLDSSDPFEGINFVVRPPKKAWKNVSNLSGGEKTLSSLALVFALHHIKPTPVYVMDEIDAALDFRNVSIVARYVLERAIGAQFIIISLRNNMFELAHQLVGICKVHDCTRSVVLNPASVAGLITSRALALQQQRNSGGRQKRDEPQSHTAPARDAKQHRRETPAIDVDA